jgi:coatomer subunit beta
MISFVIISADMEVRRKAMSIALSMTSSRNVEEVVLFLKKQLQKTQEADYEKVQSLPSFSLETQH